MDYSRPAALGSDTTGSREVIIDVMDWADTRGIDYDCIVLLQPTSPFRTAAMWRHHGIIYLRFRHGGKCLRIIGKPILQPVWETDSEGCLHVCKGDGLLRRRQDAPPVWEYNGAVYVINPDSLRRMELGEFHDAYLM